MPSHLESAAELTLLGSTIASAEPRPIEQEVLLMFDRCGPSLRRYVGSFGLSADQAEDVVQEVFLSLFRHLELGRSRDNLKGWLFQVAHNLALKHREKLRRQWAFAYAESGIGTGRATDPAPDPEARLVDRERRHRLRSVVQALPDRDRRCLILRAEGLRYREIAATLGMSLGAVAKSLTRALARLARVDGR